MRTLGGLIYDPGAHWCSIQVGAAISLTVSPKGPVVSRTRAGHRQSPEQGVGWWMLREIFLPLQSYRYGFLLSQVPVCLEFRPLSVILQILFLPSVCDKRGHKPHRFPEMVEQYGQLSGHRNDGTLFGVLSTALGESQSPSTQFAPVPGTGSPVRKGQGCAGRMRPASGAGRCCQSW